MAASHYNFTGTSQAATDLRTAIRELGEAWDKFTRQRGILIQKKDNDASGDDVYAELTTDYVFPDDATAHAAFSEIDSAFGNADSALTQCLNRFL